MDQKFGPPETEAMRRIMEEIAAEQYKAQNDPELDALRKYIETMQVVAPPPATLLPR